jgi:protein-S-isoprenylcysteine O-methyltransferase Ste14
MRALETKIPPPIAMLLLGGLVWVATRYLPALSFYLPFNRIITAALAAAGLALNLYPKLAFGRAGTTVNPLRPGSTTHLVTSGIYRYTRNPMYLGHSVLLLGSAAYLHNAVAFLAIPAFMLYISRFQIQPEERHLCTRFPDEYAAFCRRVPRWL